MEVLPSESVETWDQGEVLRHFHIGLGGSKPQSPVYLGILGTTRSTPQEVSSDSSPQALTNLSGAP